MTNEVEYKGIKIRGGKLLLILPLLGTLGGALWAGFEGYARWVAMEEKIDKYVAPDLSGFNLKLDVLEERITSLETNTGTEMSAVKELVGAAQDDARTIRTDLRSDVHDVHDQIAAVDRRSRTMEQEIRTSIRTSENDIRSLIDGKRTAIESDAQRRIETIDTKLKELEDRLRTMLERALNNPLAGQ